MSILFFLLSFTSFVLLIVGLVKPSAITKLFKKELKRKKILLIFGGLTIIFIIISVSLTDSPQVTTEDTNQQMTVIEDEVENENIGKVIKLNSCELDSENADYWKEKEVNFWETTERNSIAFKIPACDNMEVEIIDYMDNDGNEMFKVKYNEKEGWISKMQLMK